ncbi:ribosome biogenesis GTPase YqeH [Texcoconibacillus texcoconensis]|uniref:CP-type G domain-containing protein n=1 Tax=Texcoconibacillus texcoconensis TaxID=1095777 RepID=A0A840QRM1_9BACI|nr:ribosome biogenesis GTPase YqeH [Texcoconibacillus texcoconensis]MBB5173973.1 hypothetical protein [Texcoconibacillus texcoconensis]
MGTIEGRPEDMMCSGCGVTIQTEDANKLGYAPQSALSRDVVICQRCFRLKHYNEVQDVSLTDDDFLQLLNQLGQKDALIVKIVDIFDFDGSWLQGLHRFVGNNPVLLVGNKVDLLPRSVNRRRLVHWMKKMASEFGLKPIGVHLMSAARNDEVSETARLIDKWREGKDVYIVGSTNVGKSTFINQLIKQFGGDDELMITTSNVPGTTLDMIDIPLDDGATMFDTPGIINHHQIHHAVGKDDLKTIIPQKEIKPKVFQLDDGQTLFFAGLARLDIVKSQGKAVVCYMSNELNIHRTKTEKADDLYENHLGELLSPPKTEDVSSFPKLKEQEFKLPEEKTDIVFSGLGWVTVHGEGSIVRAYVPEGVNVTLRPALIT